MPDQYQLLYDCQYMQFMVPCQGGEHTVSCKQQ